MLLLPAPGITAHLVYATPGPPAEKVGGALCLTEGDELKLVHPQEGFDPAAFESLGFTHFYLQPRDGADREAHTAAVARYCVEHPRWRMSVQTHKLIGIP